MIDTTESSTSNGRMPSPLSPLRPLPNNSISNLIPGRLHHNFQTRNLLTRFLNTPDRRHPPVQILSEILDRRIPRERTMVTDEGLGQVHCAADTETIGCLIFAVLTTTVLGVGCENGEGANVDGGIVPVEGIGGDLRAGTTEETDFAGASKGIFLNGDVGDPVAVGIGGNDVIVGMGVRWLNWARTAVDRWFRWSVTEMRRKFLCQMTQMTLNLLRKFLHQVTQDIS